jgi:hypothetical protein
VTVIAMNWVEVKMSIFSVCLKGGKNNYWFYYINTSNQLGTFILCVVFFPNVSSYKTLKWQWWRSEGVVLFSGGKTNVHCNSHLTSYNEEVKKNAEL